MLIPQHLEVLLMADRDMRQPCYPLVDAGDDLIRIPPASLRVACPSESGRFGGSRSYDEDHRPGGSISCDGGAYIRNAPSEVRKDVVTLLLLSAEKTLDLSSCIGGREMNRASVAMTQSHGRRAHRRRQ